MIKIYRHGEKIPLKVGDVTFYVTPLTQAQKAEIASHARRESGQEDIDLQKMTMTSIRYSLKGMTGVEYHDGSPVELSFDENGVLTEESLNEVLYLDHSLKMIMACRNLLSGNPIDEALDGVEVLDPVRSIPSKKKSKSAAK